MLGYGIGLEFIIKVLVGVASSPGEGGISYGEKLGPAKPCPGNAEEPGAESSDRRGPLAAAAGKPADAGATTGSC